MKPMTSPSGRRRAGFTLIELLVVVAIIALLIAILLPSLGQAREKVKRLRCGTNLRAITLGYIVYTAQNNDYLPGPSGCGDAEDRYEDWIWYRDKTPNGVGQGGISVIGQGGLGPYLSLSGRTPKIMMCPSDDPSIHLHYNSSGPQPNNYYPFSYALNWYMSSFPHIKFIDHPTDPGTQGIAYRRLSAVKNADAILFYEESESTADDGNGSLWGSANLLSVRHDRRKVTTLPDVSTGSAIPNSNVLANVSFRDGHVDFVTRKYAHVRVHAVGNLNDFVSSPDPTFP